MFSEGRERVHWERMGLNKAYAFNYDSYISYLMPELNVSLRKK